MASREWFADLQNKIEMLRDSGEDYLILSVGARGPNHDMPAGNAVATVQMGHDQATAEAKYLEDAIMLARGKLLRQREARKAKEEQADG